MNYIIIGAGAIGMLTAVKGYLAGYSILLVTKTSEQSDTIKNKGIDFQQLSNKVTKIFTPTITMNELKFVPNNSWVFLTVKQKSLAIVTKKLVDRLEGNKVNIVAMQNGWGHLEYLKDNFPNSNIFAIVTTEGAYRAKENFVIHTGVGNTWIGTWQDRGDINESIGNLHTFLKNSNWQVELVSDIKRQIWYKLLINAAINPLTALLEIENGRIREDEYMLKIIKEVLKEGITITAKLGIRFDFNEIYQKVVEVSKNTAKNRSSMLQDLERKSLTEIDSINGAIVNLGREFNIATPYNELLLNLIHAKENISI